MRWTRCCAAALALAAVSGAAQAQSSVTDTPAAVTWAPSSVGTARVLAVRGRLVDGTGAAPIERGVVVVEDERIVCAGRADACRIPEGARVLDAGAGTILPGLIDLHVHSRPHYLWAFLAGGITTIRDANNSLEMVAALEAVRHRPRLFASGPMLDGAKTFMKNFPGAEILSPDAGPLDEAITLEVGTPELAAAAVDSLARRGRQVVKLYEQLGLDAFRAAAARARELGLPTMTDLGLQMTRGLNGAEVDLLQALEAGAGSIEHLSGAALAYRRLGGDPAADTLDPALVDRLARAFIETGAAAVPTLVTQAHFARETLPSAEDWPVLSRLPEEERALWLAAPPFWPAVRGPARADLRLSGALLRRIVELGGRVGAGTDTPAGPAVAPGDAIHVELELLVEHGLSPLQAIHAATGGAARILGTDELGVIAAGRLADLVVVDGDPTTDIRATRAIHWVVQNGRAFTRDELIDARHDAPKPPQTPATGGH